MVLAHDAVLRPYGIMPQSNILFRTGAAILLMKAIRACESLRRNWIASFSLSVGGSFLCAFNSSQVAVWYFLITLSAATSRSMPCADAVPATNNAAIPTATPIDLLTLILLSCLDLMDFRDSRDQVAFKHLVQHGGGDLVDQGHSRFRIGLQQIQADLLFLGWRFRLQSFQLIATCRLVFLDDFVGHRINEHALRGDGASNDQS